MSQTMSSGESPATTARILSGVERAVEGEPCGHHAGTALHFAQPETTLVDARHALGWQLRGRGADSSGRGNTSYVSVEFISAAIFSAGV